MEKHELQKWTYISTEEIIHYVENYFHNRLRFKMDEVRELFYRVVNRHGESHPELIRANELFQNFCENMMLHLLREEQILFPLLLEHSNPARRNLRELAAPLAAFSHDHDGDFFVIKEIKILTNNFTPPERACRSYTKLFENLKNLFEELELHISVEDKVLFKRFRIEEDYENSTD